MLDDDTDDVVMCTIRFDAVPKGSLPGLVSSQSSLEGVSATSSISRNADGGGKRVYVYLVALASNFSPLSHRWAPHAQFLYLSKHTATALQHTLDMQLNNSFDSSPKPEKVENERFFIVLYYYS